MAYSEIVTDAVRNLGEGIGRAGRNEHDVCPTSQLYVQNRVADFVPFLWL